jgi:hypothetical protein
MPQPAPPNYRQQRAIDVIDRATADLAKAIKPIIDTWVLQGWYKSLISLSGHGDFAEYVVPRADDIVC